MNTPLRIQRKRIDGWRKPPNTKCVTRPGPWGNPWLASELGAELAVAMFAFSPDGKSFDPTPLKHLTDEEFQIAYGRLEEYRRRDHYFPALKGFNLACYCPLCPAHAEGKPFDTVCPDCSPCHSDVLGEIANGIEVPK